MFGCHTSTEKEKQIRKSFGPFAAAHHLNGLPDGHKCASVHGHNYQVTVTLASDELTVPGFVTDFGDLAPFGAYVRHRMDHRDLNEVFDFEPTSELLANHLAEWFIANVEPAVPGRLLSVRVSESLSSWGEFVVQRDVA
ncbi:6-carboxytetrahydropterin synthase [Kitasatospora sp. RB6PN24]|uniref:6-carboxytetrahydropterin synthase n=1 Tax=Kitasatospora humi TaxID=2893891 RepID=UPI001E5580C9|nr:6-carboxytetrahydropterin synthase [Kitasatospora humi]MCC9307340.1 6-carboxytetrahydropterin synthase [Kitasatospora humi]